MALALRPARSASCSCVRPARSRRCRSRGPNGVVLTPTSQVWERGTWCATVATGSVLAPAPGQGYGLFHSQGATLLPAALGLRFRQLSPCLSRRVALQHAAEALGRAA